MKRSFLFVLAALTCVSAFAKPSKKEVTDASTVTATMQTKVDSASYAMGVYMATQMKPNLEKQGFRLDLFAQAFNAALFNSSLKMNADSANDFLVAYEKQLVQQENAQRQQAEQEFLASNKQRQGVIETPSGLQYQVVRAGEGPHPTLTDKVKVHYEGFLLNGTKFDSSIDRGKPIEFQLNRVIKGWAEGVQLMQPGAKYTLYIPYDLGYGKHGAGQAVPPYSTLIFEVELIDITTNK